MQTTLSTIANDMSELIGHTPMVYLRSDEPSSSRARTRWAPIKDRLGLAIIQEAEKAGEITPGKTDSLASDQCSCCRVAR